MSIRNVVSTLQLWNGQQPAGVRFVRPMEENDFDRPLKATTGVQSTSMDFVIPEDCVRATTKEELLDIWKENSRRQVFRGRGGRSRVAGRGALLQENDTLRLFLELLMTSLSQIPRPRSTSNCESTAMR
jgi:hypothetical protein